MLLLLSFNVDPSFSSPVTLIFNSTTAFFGLPFCLLTLFVASGAFSSEVSSPLGSFVFDVMSGSSVPRSLKLMGMTGLSAAASDFDILRPLKRL